MTQTIYLRRVSDTEWYADVHGYDFGPGNNELQVVSLDLKAIVIKSKGHSDNHGSKFSGLRQYYPGKTLVYRILESLPTDRRLPGRKLKVEEVTSWANEKGVKSQVRGWK